MDSAKYIAPAVNKDSFHCPICGVFAAQAWSDILALQANRSNYSALKTWRASYCSHCHRSSIWHGDVMLYPTGGAAPLPHPDLPEDIVDDYEEARSIVSRSPRGAAALLRLCIQKLCKELGKPGKKIDDDIASLVKDGLPVAVQKALDTVRVTGNGAVHPGSIDLRDNPELAEKLFGLVNFIVARMITEPKHIESLYGDLPENNREAIAKRDAPKAESK